jgi:hypothetical protein
MASWVASHLRADPVAYRLARLPAPHPSSLLRAPASRYRQACSELADLLRVAQDRKPRHRRTDGKSSHALSSTPNCINIEQGG